MDINFYTTIQSKIEFVTEATYIHPYLIMANNVMYSSVSADALMLCEYFENVPEKFIVALYISFSKSNDSNAQSGEEIKALYNKVVLIRAKKSKSPDELILLGRFKQILNKFLEMLVGFYKEQLTRHRLLDMIPFHKAGIWTLRMAGIDVNPNKENHLIPELVETITERKAMISLDESVESLFRFATIDSVDNSEIDFIKILLWKFPPILQISYEELKYTRNELHPVFENFSNNLNELSDQLFKISFLPENISQIKQLCGEKLLGLKDSVQKSIDESIYMARMKSNNSDEYYLRFCLGISSVPTIINYYGKSNTVESYITKEIQEQISRHTDLNSTHIFSYFEIHKEGQGPAPL